jgi:hypothetical protein
VNQFDEFIGSRQTPCTLFGIDLFAIEENIQRAGEAGTQSNGNVELPFDIVLEAHGLCLDVASKKAAFDLNTHT